MGRTFLERLARFGELPKVPACILVLLLLGGSWAVSYHTGGTKHAYPHLFYVPILLGAFFFRVPGALLTAAAAGILSGPLMPLDVEAGIAQPLGLWLFRMGFFAFIGLLTAVLFSQLDRRLAEVNRLVSALAQHHVRTLIFFAQLHEQRDKSTEGHSQRVAPRTTWPAADTSSAVIWSAGRRPACSSRTASRVTTMLCRPLPAAATPGMSTTRTPSRAAGGPV